MKSLPLYCLFICLFLDQYGLSQTVLKVDDHFESSSLINHLSLLKDYDRSIDIREILKKDSLGLFKKPPSNGLVFGADTPVYWVKVELENEEDHNKEFYLEISNPHIDVNQVFIQKVNSIDTRQICGRNYPFQNREINYRNYVYKVSLNAKEKVTIFCLADNYNTYIEIPLILWAEQSFIENLIEEELINGLFYGIILVACFIALCLLLLKPIKTHFFFFFYTLTLSIYLVAQKGFGPQFLWGDIPAFNSGSRAFSATLAIIASLQLIRVYFETKANFKKLDLWLRFVIANYIFCAVTLIIYYVVPSRPMALGPTYAQLVFMLYPFTAFFACIFVYLKTKNKSSLWFLLGFSFSMLGGIAVSIGQMGIFRNHFIMENILLISFSIDFFILLILFTVDNFSTKNKNLQLSNDLLETQKQGLQNLLTGQQQERQRLSQNLHDGASIRLANLQMRLSGLQYEITDENQKQKIQPILEELNQTSIDIRNFSHALSPVVLERYGLIFALEDLISNLENTHSDIEFQFEYDYIEKHELSISKSQSLYYISLELLNNAIKYALGNRIAISLKKEENQIQLEVNDNGIGYEPVKVSKGIGLNNIKARVMLLSGKMEIQKRQPKGMKHIILIPL